MPNPREVLVRVIERLKRPIERLPSPQTTTYVELSDPKILQDYARYKMISPETYVAKQIQKAILLELLAITGNPQAKADLAEVLLLKLGRFPQDEYFSDFIEWFRVASGNHNQVWGRPAFIQTTYSE
jgi:hypothetical protein